MSPKADHPGAALPVSQLLEIDKVCRQFEADWKAGGRPVAADYLGTMPEPHRSELKRALDAIEAEFRSKLKDQFSVDEFVRRVTLSGLMSVEEVSTFVSALPADKQPKTGEELVRRMHGQGRLTKFQAQAIYQGKTHGLVVGNYVVLDKLGQGGMGQVYKARHRKMERVVALKVLPPSATKMRDAVKRFEREVKAAARLSHPNIVAAYDADEYNGADFLVMEYVDGQDLAALVQTHGVLPVAQAVDYIVQAARGLEYAHSKGITHRDIKPSNLLVDGSDTVKILDMGLARVENAIGERDDGLTRSGSVIGTLDFMAPEQALDTHDADARSDIYSLGCTLYYLLMGRTPYRGDTVAKKLLAHREEPVPALSAERTDVPEWLDMAFQRMLAKNPADRPQTMGEVVRQLRQQELPWTHQSVTPAPVTRADGDMAETLSLNWDEVDTSSGQIDFGESWQHATESLTITRPGTSSWWMPATLAKLSKRQRIGVGVVVGALLFAVLLGIVLSLRTKDGTLIVEIDDPDVKVQVLSEEGKVLIDKPGKKGTMTIGIDPGKHRLRFEKNGVELCAKEFTIGERETIKARWEPQIQHYVFGEPPPLAVAPFDAAKAKEHQKAWADYLGMPVEMTNSIGMKFVLIPPGEYDMGTSDADFEKMKGEFLANKDSLPDAPLVGNSSRYPDCVAFEVPQHRVTITRPFYLGKCETTHLQYYTATGTHAPPDGITDGDRAAVPRVSWYEARRFCNILTARAEEKSKKFVYRLPTEAEWEYACRAGTTTRHSFGDAETDAPGHMWYVDNSGRVTHAAGVKEPNAWNLHDMHGNTWEWCSDWYSPDYYRKSPRSDPTGPPTGTMRVLRGGSSGDPVCVCRSATRAPWPPATRDMGFRVVACIPWSVERNAETVPQASNRSDVVLADFEGSDFGDWKVDGTAFGDGPARGSVLNQQTVTGFYGKGCANSYHGGDASVGKLTSPEFTITRKYITFLIGGGCQLDDVVINLLVDGKIVRTATAMSNFEDLVRWGWDVTALENKRAQIEIVDQSASEGGHILIDQIEMGDEPTSPILSKRVPTPLVVSNNVVADAAGLDYDGEKIKGVPVGSAGIWLDTLDLGKVEQGWARPQPMTSVDGHPLRIGDRVFARGVGSHAFMQWRIGLKKDALKFLATVGVDDEIYQSGSVCFEVWVDNKKVAESGLMRGLQEAKRLEVDLRGARELLLLVTEGGDGGFADHADWADAMIVVKPGGAEPESRDASLGRTVARNAVKPSWSPKGDRLVVADTPIGSGLRVVDLKTKRSTEILDFGKDPAWSPGEGRWIAFVKGEGANWNNLEVWIVEPSGDNPRRIAEGGWPSWTADGKTLLFRSNQQGKLLAIQPGEKEAKVEEVCDMPQCYFPEISPDGKQISYVEDGALRILDRATKAVTFSIAVPTKGFFFHCWSRDKKQIILTSGFSVGSSESDYGAWILDLETKELRQVLSGHYTVAAWSPDGSKIAVDDRPSNENNTRIWIIETKEIAAQKD
jgi:serine/threonine protein kinase/formylglycine-generating enzyme required for sulfatase activity